jgi:hypothetical protein
LVALGLIGITTGACLSAGATIALIVMAMLSAGWLMMK